MRAWGILLAGGVSAALAAPALVTTPVSTEKRLSAGTVDAFEVLDVSIAKGFAALKVVHQQSRGMEEPVDCAYPGMKDLPTSGVTLALWDLKAAALAQEWVVYAAADAPERCSPQATNEANLAAAKARFLEVGLDLTRRPAPVVPKDGAYALTIGGAPVRVTATRQDAFGEEETVTTATLAAAGAPFWARTWTNQRFDNLRQELVFEGAFVEGSRAVFVEHHTMISMRTHKEYLALSPVFDLAL